MKGTVIISSCPSFTENDYNLKTRSFYQNLEFIDECMFKKSDFQHRSLCFRCAFRIGWMELGTEKGIF